MNQIQQSLSSLLQNPALQSDTGARRPATAPSDSTAASDATSEELKISGGARKALAEANAEASMPVIGNFSEAQEVTQVLRDSLQDAGDAPWRAHRGIDARTASALLR